VEEPLCIFLSLSPSFWVLLLFFQSSLPVNSIPTSRVGSPDDHAPKRAFALASAVEFIRVVVARVQEELTNKIRWQIAGR